MGRPPEIKINSLAKAELSIGVWHKEGKKATFCLQKTIRGPVGQDGKRKYQHENIWLFEDQLRELKGMIEQALEKANNGGSKQ